MAPAFYSPGDQAIYNRGFSFIPRDIYRIGDPNLGTSTTAAPATGINTLVPQNISGTSGESNTGYTGGISDLITSFRDTVGARTARLEDAYDNASTAKIFGLPAFKQDVNPADAGFYVGEGMRIPQQRTMLGKMFQPQSPQEIMEEGYKPATNIGIISNLLGGFDQFGNLPRPDQAFITSQMGYTGPTVFGENQSGLSKDIFGLNTRSAFGNYAERVGKEVDSLGKALSKSASKRGLSFDASKGSLVDSAGNVIDEDDYDAAMKDFINQTKMMRAKYNFYRQQETERNEFRKQEAERIQNQLKAAALAKDKAAALAAIKEQGKQDYTPSIHGATDYGKDSGGNQSFSGDSIGAGDLGFGVASGGMGGPVSNRTGRGRTDYMDGGLADLVDIYD